MSKEPTLPAEMHNIPAEVIRGILADHRLHMVDTLDHELKELDAKPTDSDLVTGYRNGLLQARRLLDELPLPTRPYYFPDIPRINERGYHE